MHPLALLPVAEVIGTLFLPILYAAGAVWPTRARPLDRATRVAAMAAGVAVLVAGVGIVAPTHPEWLRTTLSGWLRTDIFGQCMLVLVSGIGWIVAAFSRTCLAAEPSQERYARSLLTVLAAVTTLVTSDNLVVIGATWLATSLALHQLLTFYPERRQAQLAARRKFIWCRIADASFAAAIGLWYHGIGTTSLSRIEVWASTTTSLPIAVQAGCVLAVVAAVLRTAQLPCHGWLLQVMEAPTPVSALLHAGVINIAGFVLVRLAPLMALAPAAQTLLVLIGTATAVLASIAATTRPNVKEALAWSTCAQMGFMLVQCAMGWWHLAFLHLLAHSVYKAHAFLCAGSQVDSWLAQGEMHAERNPSTNAASPWLAQACLLACVGTSVYLLSRSGAAEGSDLWPSVALLAAAVVTLRLEASRRLTLGDGFFWRSAALMTVSFFGAHLLARALFAPAVSYTPSPLSWVVLGSGFGLLWAYQVLMQRSPGSPLSMRIWSAASSGYYIDAIAARALHRFVGIPHALEEGGYPHGLSPVFAPLRKAEHGIS